MVGVVELAGGESGVGSVGHGAVVPARARWPKMNGGRQQRPMAAAHGLGLPQRGRRERRRCGRLTGRERR
uniref:Uncharacterized protein n=1 Tax=Arundo donax TaxID=35708 RepID=A0A0A9G8P7_ARUDO